MSRIEAIEQAVKIHGDTWDVRARVAAAWDDLHGPEARTARRTALLQARTDCALDYLGQAARFTEHTGIEQIHDWVAALLRSET